MPNIGCGLDRLSWSEVLKILQDTFIDSGVIQIISRNELDCKTTNKPTNSETYKEDEIDNYTNEWTKENEPETDFTKDSVVVCVP